MSQRLFSALLLFTVCSSRLDADENRNKLALSAAVSQYCIGCHGDNDDAEAGIRLASEFTTTQKHDAEVLRKLIHVLDTRAMPPEDEPQPPLKLRNQMLTELRQQLHQATASGDAKGRTPIRRMNRFQYNNAVVDLLNLNCIVFTLPERALRVHRGYFDPASGRMPDVVSVGNRPLGKSQLIEPRLAGVAAFPQDLRAEHGYNNQADHLSLSPLLMDEFLKLGESITQSPDFSPKRVGIWKSFFEKPSANIDVENEIRTRLTILLTKAFRQSVDDELLHRYSEFVIASIKNGATFTEAMKASVAAIIASPRFLYLYDKAETASDNAISHAGRVSDWELASRLSFFLWGSLPDATLIELAQKNELHHEDVLNSQITRMLRDQKLKRFCDSFPSQWLQLDRIVSSIPNREQFPQFYFSKYRMSMHMMLEPLLLFETVLIENLPITQLIDSDFSYRSAGLERSYGVLGTSSGGGGGGVGVLMFNRLEVKDRRTGGVITNAAVMTMTSGPERTQPITRGAWIAAVIFNDPPEPPPADVPPLAEKPIAGEENLTLRERLAAHRERADCRGCHEQIDPLGFALENYNPVGMWREKYDNGRPIDASGQLFRQHSFTDAVEFKDSILIEKDRFCRALAGHLLSFALARELAPADELALDKITQTVAADGYKMQTLIRQIILSEPFRTK